MKSSHQDRPLVVGCNIGVNVFPLADIRQDIRQTNNSKSTSNTYVILDSSYHCNVLINFVISFLNRLFKDIKKGEMS